MTSFFRRLHRHLPERVHIDAREQARSVLGAMLGLCIAGAVSGLLLGGPAGAGWLVAPMGASAVLLFALPASPLAQPWPMLAGNLLSTLIGVACASLIPHPLIAASVAVAVAIAAMFLLRCLHPPGGALALGAALAGHGIGAALAPVAINCLLLVAAAVAYNNLCGRRYPHRPADHANVHHTDDAPPTERLGITPADLDAVLGRYNQLLDISRDDLEEILQRTEVQAHQRRFGTVTCGDIMSRDVVKAEFGTDLQAAWQQLQAHDIQAMPVVNRFNRVIGMLSRQDFFRHAGAGPVDGMGAALRRLLRRTPDTHSDKAEVVGQIMAAPVETAFVDDPIAALVARFADSGLRHLPITDRNGRLAGIVTQSDLLAALYRTALDEAEALGRPPRRLATLAR